MGIMGKMSPAIQKQNQGTVRVIFSNAAISIIDNTAENWISALVY